MKPPQLFAREREWAALSSAFGKRSAGLVIVLGRRRQGKTTLVAAATKASGGLYFCAAEQSPEQNLEDFGRALSEWRNDGLPVRFGSWSEALERAGLVLHGAPLCIDEVGYLIARAPEVPSIVQRLVDGHGTSSARFILCGSSVSMLTELTKANQPLRGRAARTSAASVSIQRHYIRSVGSPRAVRLYKTTKLTDTVTEAMVSTSRIVPML